MLLKRTQQRIELDQTPELLESIGKDRLACLRFLRIPTGLPARQQADVIDVPAIVDL